jgi:site-specific recombinase XerD
MASKINITFYQRTNVVNHEEVAYIYCRVTIATKRSQFATGIQCPSNMWHTDLKRIDTKFKDAKAANNELSRIETRLQQIHLMLSHGDKKVTAQQVVNKFLGKDVNGRTLLQVFKQHNAKMKSLIDIEYAKATYSRFESTLKHIEEFIKSKYKQSDVYLQDLDNNFVHDFDYFLRTTKSCGHNTTVKYIKNLSKIVRISCENGWLDKFPFSNYKQRSKEVERVFLTSEELERIYKKDFGVNRLDAVRDIFLFSCYTGLAYVDVQRLNAGHIVVGIDGNKWININRKKTEVKSSIPLLPVAEELIYKYEEVMKHDKQQRVLPSMSNQKLNAYLKEIAVVCDINKELTFHVARHTFATTVTLTNGVPIESVSKMLGHSSIKMTQHYAKIVDRKLSDDMKMLREKLKPNKSNPTTILKAIK